MLQTYIILLGESGIRCKSEALRLKWEDIDLEEATLRIASGRDGHRTKSGKSRVVPITPRLNTALKEHLAAYRFAGSAWVFHHTINHGKRKQHARINCLDHSLKAAAQRARLPKEFHQHDLRHRRVTIWLAEGENSVDVQHWMGHSSIVTTMRYYHHVPKHLRVRQAVVTTTPVEAVQSA